MVKARNLFESQQQILRFAQDDKMPDISLP